MLLPAPGAGKRPPNALPPSILTLRSAGKRDVTKLPHHKRAESRAVSKGHRESSQEGRDEGKGEPGLWGAGGHSSLTFNHRQAAALGCERNKSDRCGLLKSNIIWGDYHTERHGESSAQRGTHEEFGCSESAGWCVLSRAGRASPARPGRASPLALAPRALCGHTQPRKGLHR